MTRDKGGGGGGDVDCDPLEYPWLDLPERMESNFDTFQVGRFGSYLIFRASL